jgi:hypothetical protein
MLSINNRIVLTSLVLLLAFVVSLAPLGSVLAANPPGTSQPNQSCEDAGVTPGHAANAPGSAFNPNGMAGSVYAGEQPQNSVNPHSVSQYDVACFQVSQH